MARGLHVSVICRSGNLSFPDNEFGSLSPNTLTGVTRYSGDPASSIDSFVDIYHLTIELAVARWHPNTDHVGHPRTPAIYPPSNFIWRKSKGCTYMHDSTYQYKSWHAY